MRYPVNSSSEIKSTPLYTWKVSETTGGCMKVWAAICGGKVGNVGNGLGGCAGCFVVVVELYPGKFQPRDKTHK